MRCHAIALILFLTFLLHSGVSAAEEEKPEAGPENGGLRLRLIIENDLKSKIDRRSIRLELLNDGPNAVKLVGQWEYERPGDFSAWLRHAAEFTTFPEVQIDMAGTSGQERKSPQPEHVLKPGEPLVISWSEDGPILKQPDDYWVDHMNCAPTLPSTGMYLVRARVTVVNEAEERLLLVSNEQPVIIGGQKTLPKFATSQLISVSEKEKTAEIRLGSDQRIEAGDVFMLHHPEIKGIAWKLRITESHSWWSKGAVEQFNSDLSTAEYFPQPGWLATLVSPETALRADARWLSREVAAALPSGWKLMEYGFEESPNRWTGKTTAMVIHIRHESFKFALDRMSPAQFTLWLTPPDYTGELESSDREQPGGALYWGSSNDYRWFVEALAPEPDHWKAVEQALFKRFSIQKSAHAGKVQPVKRGSR